MRGAEVAAVFSSFVSFSRRFGRCLTRCACASRGVRTVMRSKSSKRLSNGKNYVRQPVRAAHGSAPRTIELTSGQRQNSRLRVSLSLRSSRHALTSPLAKKYTRRARAHQTETRDTAICDLYPAGPAQPPCAIAVRASRRTGGINFGQPCNKEAVGTCDRRMRGRPKPCVRRARRCQRSSSSRR